MFLTTIIIFLLMVGSSFAVLGKSGILKAAIARVVRAFERRKYRLLLVVSLLFMLMGAFFGIFEEVVPFVPVMIALFYFLGWDPLVGLEMNILATNMGFSAAILNPFTISAWRSRSRACPSSPAPGLDSLSEANPRLGKAIGWFLAFFLLILGVLMVGLFLPTISQFALPLVELFSFSHASPFLAALIVYALALFIEFFIASGSAKLKLWLWVLLVTVAFLGGGVAINFGPF